MSDQKTLQLTVATIDRSLFDGLAQSVTVPGIQGEMQILPHHEALISPLVAGTVSVTKEDGSVEQFEVVTGTIEVSNNRAMVLV